MNANNKRTKGKTGTQIRPVGCWWKWNLAMVETGFGARETKTGHDRIE